MVYVILTGVLLHATWVFFDALKRRRHRPGEAAMWAIGTMLLWLFVVPIYFAKRNLREGETREGGVGWNALRIFALLWTMVMVAVAIASLAGMGHVVSSARAGAEQAGAAIGSMLGLGLVAALWFFPMCGALLAGMFIRKPGFVERGPTAASGGQEPATTAAPKKSNVGFVVVLPAIVGVACVLFVYGREAIRRPSSPKASAAADEDQPVSPTRNAGKDRAFKFATGTALFRGDLLDECVDMEFCVTKDPGGQGDLGAEIAQRLKKGMEEMIKKAPRDQSGILLQVPCSQQFSDRKPFATCMLPPHAEEGNHEKFGPNPDAPLSPDTESGTKEGNHYSFEILVEQPLLVRDCLRQRCNHERVFGNGGKVGGCLTKFR